ncbi:IclR family transcriptional regulator [Saccharopolyspora spinosa]|uniref:IclR family transcriptional regulator n=1 Tax=Saccharopolyspora spinosa TaxID=60894 RepID=A0A2N3XXV8_SACSN|nr:helix-turn-helix domain-containing protein [Saccharopolyspora spinosa]PKW15469.1 IclR family transcriptional regulator [Saccharopolyspora spinosa]
MAAEAESDVARGAQGPPLKHRMIARVAEILELAAREREGVSLTEFAQRLSAPVSSVQSLVNGLVETGYLTKSGRKYVLGPAPYVLHLIAQREPIRVVRHSDLEALHEATGLTAYLGINLAGRAIYLDHVTGDPAFAYLAETHAPRPLLRTAVGRILLANLDKRLLFEILRNVDEQDQPLVEPFLQEIPAILEADYAATQGLVASDHWAVAAPVRENGKTVAAVALTGTPEEMKDDLDRLGVLLRERAQLWENRVPDSY